MKFKVFCYIIFVLVLVAVVSGDKVWPKNPLEGKILGVLNKWRKGGVQTKLFPLPSLRSINIMEVQSYYEGKGINIIFSIGEMKLTGLDNFSVERLNVRQTQDILNISAIIIVPTLTLHSDTYELTGWAYYVYPLKGLGAMTIVSRNNLITFNIRFTNVNNTYTAIEEFSVHYSIGRVDADLENSSWPISRVLNNEGVSILESYQEEINNAVRDYVVPYANEYLSHVTPKDFMSIITDISLNAYVIEDIMK